MGYLYQLISLIFKYGLTRGLLNLPVLKKKGVLALLISFVTILLIPALMCTFFLNFSLWFILLLLF